jgi:hypothetical protein
MDCYLTHKTVQVKITNQKHEGNKSTCHSLIFKQGRLGEEKLLEKT